ncbi:MAG TPA: OsmC family protein [Humisphaera sp.]
MPTRTADATWNGSLLEGKGQVSLGNKAFTGPIDWKSRAESGPNTNPEELLAAAHSACYSMALSHGLASAGHPPKRVHTTAKVTFEKQGDGFAITGIALSVEAEVPGLDQAGFQKFADGAKTGCPVSKALSATPITLTAKLV